MNNLLYDFILLLFCDTTLVPSALIMRIMFELFSNSIGFNEF